MNKLQFTVSEECIGCRACVDVAEANFEIDDNNLAYLKKQPEGKEEENHCKDALEVCPVDAISVSENVISITENAISVTENAPSATLEPILSRAIIKTTLDTYPQLKPVLLKLSPKFQKLQNPAMYNTIARFATFKDAARLAGLSVCEILHALNHALGIEDKLIEQMPDCISLHKEDEITGEEITWKESPERYIYNADVISELMEKVSHLAPQENMVIISVEEPGALLKAAIGLGLKLNIEKGRDFRVSLFNPKVEEKVTDWTERKADFEILDVRAMKTDPFDIIIKKSYEVKEDSGFLLIQRFEPVPMISMLHEMGFESITEQKAPNEIWVYFHKKVAVTEQDIQDSDKPSVVIQSATPVAYPIMMRLLQSETIRKAINIKELKVWEETEKHLSWIVNGRADISFSALITSSKLKDSDIKIPALFVWDNFYILTRGYQANSLEDIRGKKIHTPLFEEAPPAKITRYLIKAKGLDADDFNFVYGQPFGRPEQIFKDFIRGQADTVILREPEASYAIKTMEKIGQEFSVISYNELWNEINEDFGSFPNAGIVLKGEFVRKHPELTQTFLNELKKAIKWVNENKLASARLSFDMMRQPVENIELFLNRVKFEYVDGDELINKVSDYFNILVAEGIVDTKINDQFLNIFKLNN